MKSDRPYLGHIADSIAAIESYVAGGRETFLQERLIQDAVIRNFEIYRRSGGSTRLANYHRTPPSGTDRNDEGKAPIIWSAKCKDTAQQRG